MTVAEKLSSFPLVVDIVDAHVHVEAWELHALVN